MPYPKDLETILLGYREDRFNNKQGCVTEASSMYPAFQETCNPIDSPVLIYASAQMSPSPKSPLPELYCLSFKVLVICPLLSFPFPWVKATMLSFAPYPVPCICLQFQHLSE